VGVLGCLGVLGCTCPLGQGEMGDAAANRAANSGRRALLQQQHK
jgi:hypothetical protein